VSEQESDAGLQIRPPSDPWDKLPALAKRLGVEQCKSADVMITTSKGERYDMFELINAFLDRLEEKLP